MRGGLIIRLIDIVLIILFGFIGISDIQVKQQIQASGESAEEDITEDIPPENDVYLFINIYFEGLYEIVIDGETQYATSKLDVLREWLNEKEAQLINEKKRMLVLVNPLEDATMQQTIDVFDLCDEEGFTKTIDFQFTEGTGENL